MVDRLCITGVLPPNVAIRSLRSHRLHGLPIVRALRATGFESALIVLGTFQSDDERIALFEAGADHVLDVRTTTSELIAWIRSTLRRPRPERPQAPSPSDSDLELNWTTLTIERRDTRAHLTMTEFDVIAVLARNPGRIVSRQLILLLVWGITCEANTNVLNAQIWSLRRKLASVGAPDALRTTRGLGFILACSTTDASASGPTPDEATQVPSK
ncbi:winged helix-turn-helix transcriptional regulator [Rhodococcus koreensis]